MKQSDKNIQIKTNRGITLIELLIALAMSSILIAAIYKVFISQQKSYVVQEQVVDMQQNMRASISRMMSEIRMAGFGSVEAVLEGVDGVNGFHQVITPGENSITVVGGFKQIRRNNGNPITVSSISENTITLNYSTEEFDRPAHQYISIGGVESSTVIHRKGRILTLANTLRLNHAKDTPIFKIQAITYAVGKNDGKSILQRNENTGGGGQPIAENIEDLQFEYLDSNGNPTAFPEDIRMVKVTVTSRTDISDPQLKGGDGYRRRQIGSNISIRNMGFDR
jgi:prepilin-type N-terminal cleavage/methylation domain-containing protein